MQDSIQPDLLPKSRDRAEQVKTPSVSSLADFLEKGKWGLGFVCLFFILHSLYDAELSLFTQAGV